MLNPLLSERSTFFRLTPAVSIHSFTSSFSIDFFSRPRILPFFFSALRSRKHLHGKTAFARTRNDDARIAVPTMRILIYSMAFDIFVTCKHYHAVDAKTWKFLKERKYLEETRALIDQRRAFLRHGCGLDGLETSFMHYFENASNGILTGFLI